MNTGPSQVEEKLEDKQKALRESIEKGEPKIFGVSERRVMASLILKGSAQLTYSSSFLFIYFLFIFLKRRIVNFGVSFRWYFYELT